MPKLFMRQLISSNFGALYTEMQHNILTSYTSRKYLLQLHVDVITHANHEYITLSLRLTGKVDACNENDDKLSYLRAIANIFSSA